MSREAVRQAFKTAAATAYSGPIFTTRQNDHRENAEFLCIYISNGDVNHSFNGIETEAALYIQLTKHNATDAALDSAMDAINTALLSHDDVISAVKFAKQESFEYGIESTNAPSLTYSYKILF